MSLLKSFFGALSIFEKDEPQHHVSADNLNDALKRASEMRCKMNGFKLDKPRLFKNNKSGYMTGYAGTGYYSNGVRIDDDREWHEH